MAARLDSPGNPRLVDLRGGRTVMAEMYSSEYNASAARHRAEFASLMFIHGSMANRRQFSKLMLYCRDMGVDMVCYDAYGCGDSPKPRMFDVYAESELVEDADTILTTLCKHPCVIVGHSFGANVAIQLAARHRNTSCIASLVLLGAGLTPPLQQTWIFHLPEWVLCCFRHQLNQAFIKKAYHPGTDRGILATAYAECDANPWHVITAFYRQLQWTCQTCVSDVTVPCLVVTGETDGIFPPEEGRRLTSALPNAVFVVCRKAAHQLMQEVPDAVYVEMEHFLRSRRLLT